MQSPLASRFSRRSRAFVAAITLTVSVGSVSAATLTYDADTTAPANDGAGVWNTTSANWYDGANDVVWPNTTADTAIFGVGGTGGTVMVGTVNAGTIQFNATATTGYTLNTGTITLGTGIVNNNAALGSTIGAKISGANGLAYSGTGTGTVSLNGANDYTGITTLTGAGSLGTNSTNSLGSSAGATASALGTNYTQVGSGTTVRLGSAVAEAFVINGTGGTNGALRFVNPVTLSSLIQLGSNSTITGAFSSGNVLNGNIDLQSFTLSINNASGTINGVIGGTGGLSVGSNVNPLNLTNTANSFSGTLTVGAGTVGLGSNGVLGASTLVFNSGGIQSTDATARTVGNVLGTFTGNATFGQTATQTGTLSFTNTTAANLNAAARTFTTNVNTSFANAFTGTGASGITKAGTATLTLTGASTYAGATTISAGALLVNNITGSGTGAGLLTVAAGATLGGTGTVGGIAGATGVVTNNGIIAPGDPAVNAGIGTLTIGSVGVNRNLAFGAGSSLNIGVTGATSDLLAINGGLDLSNADTLNITGALDGTTSYTIATFTGALAGTFDAVTGLTGSYTVQYNANSITLAVPEPSTYALLGLGLGGLALAVARRRRLAA